MEKIEHSAKLLLIGAIAIIILSLTSCRTGYGCHGNSRYITGYRSPMGFGY